MMKLWLTGVLALLACIRPLALPGAVELLSPADSATVAAPVVEFAWSADAGGAWEFQLAADSRFRSMLRVDTVTVDSGPAVRWQVDLRRDGTYWWRVRVRGGDSTWGNFSEERTLELRRFDVLAARPTPGYAQAVCVAGERAYVADGQAGLAVFDVADPANPRYLASVMDSLNEARGVAVRGRHAFVAYGYKELLIADVADPDSLRVIGELEYPTPGYGFDVALRDSLVYIAADAQFIVVNTADPAYPNLRFQHRYPRGLRGVAIEDTLCWLALEQLGVAAWNIAALPPVPLGSLDTPSNARSVAASGGIVYVADGRGGLVVVDGRDPSAPAVLAILDLPGYAGQVTVSGARVYVGCGEGGLVIVDAGVPAEPFIVAAIKLSYVRGGVESGGHIYACDRDLGLVVISREEAR